MVAKSSGYDNESVFSIMKKAVKRKSRGRRYIQM
jgi:hypothetical protein